MARKYSALKTMARSAKSNATRAAKTSLYTAMWGEKPNQKKRIRTSK